MTKKKVSEEQTLQQYHAAINNAGTQPKIAEIMSEFGYNNKALAEGRRLLNETRAAFEANQLEDNETIDSYQAFDQLRSELTKTYTLHRKKARVVFRKDPKSLEKLGIVGSTPQAYANWFKVARQFYLVALKEEAISNSLSRLKISNEELAATQKLIEKVDQARSEYLREKGESQAATKAKDAAFSRIDDWMSEFYLVSRIALEDDPQLLEVLGKVVKS
jgi:hypothetical protein